MTAKEAAPMAMKTTSPRSVKAARVGSEELGGSGGGSSTDLVAEAVKAMVARVMKSIAVKAKTVGVSLWTR